MEFAASSRLDLDRLANARLYEAQRNSTTCQGTSSTNPSRRPRTRRRLKPANEPELVGGDFSDVFVVDETHVVAIIGDVAGKGVRAAGMTTPCAARCEHWHVDCSPAFILAKANELLLRSNPTSPT